MNGISYARTLVLRLQTQNRVTKFMVTIIADFTLLNLCVFVAYVLRISAFEFPPSPSLWLYFIGPILSISLATFLGAYGSVMRTYTFDTELKILRSQLAVIPLWALAILIFGAQGFARSVVVIYFLLAVLAMVLLRRLFALFVRDKAFAIVAHDLIPVVIYGAGREGVALVEVLRRQGRFKPMAFIDTDYTLVGRSVAGLSVLSTDNMEQVMNRFKPREVMIAKPRQNRANRRALVDRFIGFGLQVKTIPDMSELADGNIDLTGLRPIRLEDLLGRDPVPPVRHLMEKSVKGQVVMVTGAGGSIGSELVRQAAGFEPKKIVMVENNEFSLFEINREIEARMGHTSKPVPIVALLADTKDKAQIGAIMAEHGVEVVLHAAAYKHVRMVQENPVAGIYNNIWGTKHVAEAAIKQGVKLFILVSTDKAVRPTSVMGSSKRVAELLIQGLAGLKNHKTVFAIVRFGNVLGSTGSVVPIFRAQISAGGPVLVTHEEVTRYFMLIPEAAQLVIQAGAMAKGGDVFVLDMGDPIKIVELAETMIELAGFSRKSDENPSGDMEIRFVGLREGEKLYEELQIGRDISSTNHSRIMVSNEYCETWESISKELSIVEKLIAIKKVQDAVARVSALSWLGS